MHAEQPRVFSIEEANALVPQLNDMVGGQMQLADEILQLVCHLGAEQQGFGVSAAAPAGGAGFSQAAELAVEVVDITPHTTDSIEVRALKRKLNKIVRRYHQGWQQVQQLGVIIKDPTAGWLDFYGRIDSKLVCFCWRYGEAGVDHYHDLDAGMTDRKPLGPVRKHTLN